MMDFDDLDEVAADRAAAGELDEAAAAAALGPVEAPGDFRGGHIWPLPRNKQFPGLDVIPERMRNTLGEFHKASRIRLFVFYGAGDSFPFWAQWMCETPEWVEAAIYEWPSHGSRDDEKLPDHVDGVVADAVEGLQAALKQHAKDGPLEGAPFALAGHSIGVRIMIGVAERIKVKLGLEPRVCFVLDRAAPQHPLTSAFGQKLLQEDPEDWIRIFNPQVHGIYTKAKLAAREKGASEEEIKERRMLEMWMGDICFQTQTKPEGYHLFKCPLHVFVAMYNWAMDSEEARKMMSPADLKGTQELASIVNSAEGSSALWDYGMYEDWRQWTTAGCTIHNMEVDHTGLKRFPPLLKSMWSILADLRAST